MSSFNLYFTRINPRLWTHEIILYAQNYSTQSLPQTIHTSDLLTPHTTLQQASDFALKVESEYLLVEGIHQTDQDAVMSINALGLISQDPVRQQRLVNMSCYKCGQKRNLQKDCPNAFNFLAGTPTTSQDTQNQHTHAPMTIRQSLIV